MVSEHDSSTDAGHGTRASRKTLAAIIEHRAAGLSWVKVADKLNATGHRTRTGGRWTRQGAHQVHQAREHGAAA